MALLILDPSLFKSGRCRERFLGNLGEWALQHRANLVSYYGPGEEDGEIYLGMDYCDGGNLRSLVRRTGPLTERCAALIGMQIAAGLASLHSRVGHYNLRPSSVLLRASIPQGTTHDELAFILENDDSFCIVADHALMGLLREANDGFSLEFRKTVCRVPMFAAPEQLLGQENIDYRTDIYSAGMLMWFLVQGGRSSAGFKRPGISQSGGGHRASSVPGFPRA